MYSSMYICRLCLKAIDLFLDNGEVGPKHVISYGRNILDGRVSFGLFQLYRFSDSMQYITNPEEWQQKQQRRRVQRHCGGALQQGIQVCNIRCDWFIIDWTVW